MRGSTSSTYCTPSTVTLTCAMSPSSSPGTGRSGDALGPDLPWIGARDRAPRQCGGEHIAALIIDRGNIRVGLIGPEPHTGRHTRFTGCGDVSQMRAQAHTASVSAEK